MTELSLNSEEILYVGDSDTDMICGKRAKLKTIGVLWGFRTEDELLRNGADFVISTPEELLKFI